MTLSIFKKPVTLIPTGTVVEEKTAIQIINSTKRDPLHHSPITSYIRNVPIEQLVEIYLTKYPQFCEEQYSYEDNNDQHANLIAGEPFDAEPSNEELIHIAESFDNFPVQVQPVVQQQNSVQYFSAFFNHDVQQEINNLLYLPTIVAINKSSIGDETPVNVMTYTRGETQHHKLIDGLIARSFSCNRGIGIEFHVRTIDQKKLQIWEPLHSLSLGLGHMERVFYKNFHILYFLADNNNGLQDLLRHSTNLCEGNEIQLYKIEYDNHQQPQFTLLDSNELEAVQAHSLNNYTTYNYNQVCDNLMQNTLAFYLSNQPQDGLNIEQQNNEVTEANQAETKNKCCVM